MSLAGLERFCAAGQAQLKACPRTFVIHQVKLAAMSLGKLTGNGKAKPRAASAARSGKGLEQVGAHPLGHAWTCIGHAN